MTNYTKLVSVIVIRPAVCATQWLSNSGFCPLTELGDRGPQHPDDYVSEKWLPCL